MTDDEEAERPPRLVRFDFPPGAGPKQIAEAIEAARKRLREEWEKRKMAAMNPDDPEDVGRPDQ